MPQLQPQGQFPAQKPGGMFQRLKGLLNYLGVSPDGHLHSGVTRVGTYLHIADIHVQQARIFHFEADNLAEFFLNGLGNPQNTSYIHKNTCRTGQKLI